MAMASLLQDVEYFGQTLKAMSDPVPGRCTHNPQPPTMRGQILNERDGRQKKSGDRQLGAYLFGVSINQADVRCPYFSRHLHPPQKWDITSILYCERREAPRYQPYGEDHLVASKKCFQIADTECPHPIPISSYGGGDDTKSRGHVLDSAGSSPIPETTLIGTGGQHPLASLILSMP